MTSTLLIITGPTASGKTILSVEIAKQFNTEIISADSRQMYKEMRIGTAVPSDDLLAKVKHHFIQSISVNDYYNASMFECEVLHLLNELFIHHKVVIMTGGSGLYIDAVCNGIDDLPDVDSAVRNELMVRLQNEGFESLRMDLKRLDPMYYQTCDLQNPARVLKAIEISTMTGKPYSSFLTRTKKQRNFNIIKLAINPERNTLYNRINNRVDEMVLAGLEEEAHTLFSLWQERHPNSLNTVGYKEWFRYFSGELSKSKAIDQIKQNTRHYAKRQITWFKRDKQIVWFDEPSCILQNTLISSLLVK